VVELVRPARGSESQERSDGRDGILRPFGPQNDRVSCGASSGMLTAQALILSLSPWEREPR
jgi:hypothetical protein